MKKFKTVFSALLSVVLLFSATACAGNEDTKKTEKKESEKSTVEETTVEETTVDETEAPTEEETETPEESEAPVKAAESLSKEAVYHFTFDEADENIKTVIQTEDKGEYTDATFGIKESTTYVDKDGSEKEIEAKFVPGPVGNALYMDGKYGLKLPIEPLGTETYTISFWINADRLGNFGPTLQMGSNIGKLDTENRVTWLSVTQTDFGLDGAQLFPVIWSRNSETTAWPWVSAYDDTVHGKKEWLLVTVVASGNIFSVTKEEAEAGLPRNGIKLFLNGNKVYESEEGMYPGVVTELMKKGEPFEAFFGINNWDVVYKGHVDDLYLFDYALSDEEVAYLYNLGDKEIISQKAE